MTNNNKVNMGYYTACYMAMAVGLSLALRFAMSLHSYSGENQPPMFGDYEAQRHWMEITIALPVQDWYTNSSFNNLQYWGLDYPPLTAYHSWAMGRVAGIVDPSFVRPTQSRGLESPELKTFMRSTVFAADVLFIAAILYYYLTIAAKKKNTVRLAEYVFISLSYPAFILVDHGHFQYNCIPLGLTVLAITCLRKDKFLQAAILFTLAVNYKQMSLYHSLPFFVYILRRCLTLNMKKGNILLLSAVASVVLGTFLATWFPFLLKPSTLSGVVARIFPVGRGIFEDKVGNVWCAVNVVYKLKQMMSNESLVRLCGFSTLATSVPSLACLAAFPSNRQFLLSLINVSLSFFLCSYHVHEKTILLAALPVALYAHYDLLPCCWFLCVANVSLLHLAIKDNLLSPYITLTILFYSYLFSNKHFFVQERKNSWKWLIILSPSFVGSLVLCFGFKIVVPPPQYPDLWPLLTALYSCAHFVGFYLYFNVAQIASCYSSLCKNVPATAPPRRRRLHFRPQTTSTPVSPR